jgi:hypothetical protein
MQVRDQRPGGTCAPGTIITSYNSPCYTITFTFPAGMLYDAARNPVTSLAIGIPAVRWRYCWSCRPGSYQDLSDQTQCKSCAKGKFQPWYAQTDCPDCWAGKFNPYTHNSRCYTPGPGRYVPRSGMLATMVCPKGKYSYAGRTEVRTEPPFTQVNIFGVVNGAGRKLYELDAKTTRCARCPKSWYAPNDGQTHCNFAWCPRDHYFIGGDPQFTLGGVGNGVVPEVDTSTYGIEDKNGLRVKQVPLGHTGQWGGPKFQCKTTITEWTKTEWTAMACHRKNLPVPRLDTDAGWSDTGGFCQPCTGVDMWCPRGQYRKGCWYHNKGKCKTCGSCPVGQYRILCGIDALPSYDSHHPDYHGGCLKCPMGKYKPQGKPGVWSDMCQVCTPPPPIPSHLLSLLCGRVASLLCGRVASLLCVQQSSLLLTPTPILIQ